MGRRVRRWLGTRGGPAARFLGPASAIFSLALAGGACTQPQSGVYTKKWCQPDTVVDDMEDGDGDLCPGVWNGGTWSVEKHEADTNTMPLGAIDDMHELDAPLSGAKPSQRDIQLIGTGFRNETGFGRPWAVVTATFGDTLDLNAYAGIRFRAFALGSVRATPLMGVQIRTGVVTSATSDPAGAMACDESYPDHWGKPTTLAVDSWTDVEVAIDALTQQACVAARPDRAADIAETRGIEIRYAPFFLDGTGAPNSAENLFTIEIDDVELVAR